MSSVRLGIIVIAVFFLFACGDKKNDAKDTDNEAVTTPTPVKSGAFTYLLTESTESLPLWTTPVTHKITLGSRPPSETKSGLSLSAAKNEFEAVQLIIGPTAGEVTVTVGGFDSLGQSKRIDLFVASFEQGWVEVLSPIASGDAVALSNDNGTPVWFDFYIPKDAPSGEHTGTVTIEQENERVTVPITLYVFDFVLPDETHFATQMNVSIQSLMTGDTAASDVKTLLFEHKMTPKSVTWPSGFSWNITWENDNAPNKCEQFYDESDEGDLYSIGKLAPKYILGQGWNGIGFPNAMVFQFVDNSTPRPDTFCGISRGSHEGSTEYNTAWFSWLTALDDYLVENGFDTKAYYYVQNEPQNAEDEALAAHLCRLTKKAAPNLRIAISEEPKPSIAEDAGGDCGYDIWIAHIRAYEQKYAWQRQANYGEQVWFYSLDHDPDPYFNPTQVNNQGIHQRIIPWAAWSHRITGFAYYDAGRYFHEGIPGVRGKLFREGFEDYEYLWLINNNAHPAVNETISVDATVKSVAASMSSFTKDADALMTVRHELGLYIEGTRETLPALQVASKRKAGNYYINFQDVEGEPSTSPLVVDGNEYMKIGWSDYDETNGYGWSGEYVGTDIVKYGFANVSGFNDVQRSFIYDDYGRDNLFEFEIEPGTYDVTVGIGYAGKPYEGQPHNVTIEGQKVVDDEPTTSENTVIEKTVTIDITDGSLSMVTGGKSPSINDWSYTFLAYLKIEHQK